MLTPGLQIAECRSQKGWTQKQLCERVGLAQANLSNIEKGKKDFTVSTLLRIASALEVTPAQLFISPQAVKSFTLGRKEVERLAEAVIDPNLKVSPPIRALAETCRFVFTACPNAVSRQKIERAWIQLRQKFSSDEIKTLSQRVEDARLRRVS